MTKKDLYRGIEVAIALGVCAYLIVKLVQFDDYSSLWASLRAMGAYQWLALALCVLLMPANMELEVWRWATLMTNGNGKMENGKWSMPFREMRRQVYYGKMAGMLTPWKLGDYPARALLISDGSQESGDKSQDSRVKEALAMGVVGSATMTLAIVLGGMIGIAFSPRVLTYLGESYLYAFGIVMIAGTGLTALLPRLLRRWAIIDRDLLLRSLAQSGARLICWCIQLILVLYALGATSGEWPMTETLVYYLLVTLTPNVPVAEIGVRGAWAILVFGSVNAALAGVLLWVINSVLPCFIWLFMRKKQQ